MAYHPRENWVRGSTGRYMLSRREFLIRAGVLGVALPTLPSLLAACGDGSGGSEVVDLAIGTPANPVTQPLFEDNVMIASGRAAESGPLRIYNWADYLNPDVIPVAEEALGTTIELTTFFNEEEAIQKLASGEVAFDVWFPVASTVPKAVAAKLIQPINHDYLGNLSNVWPQLADPYYDQGSQYTVPYTVYQTGLAWRNDMVDSADIEALENPWDIFWDPKYKGITGLYDDFRETLDVAFFRLGISDTRSAPQEDLDKAAESLIELVDLMNIRYTIDGVYTGIPEGKFGLHTAWSGDVVATPFYFPEDGDPTVMRYLWPAHAPGTTNAKISNDTMAVLRNAENPVLAHQFMDFMLNEGNALENFGWVGYQPPQNGLNVDLLVADEWVPPYLDSAIVLPGDFDDPRGVVPYPLEPDVEGRWLDAWSRVKAGG